MKIKRRKNFVEPVTLGGFEQYLLIRGRDRELPVLLFLHGSPGTPETALFRHYNSELDRDFVVVHWEQRGSGKSFSGDLDPETLTIERMLSDLDELYPEFRVPVYFFLGRHDRHVSADLAEEYFNRLKAPYKELIWFEQSAHNPPYEEPENFNREVLRIGRELFLRE